MAGVLELVEDTEPLLASEEVLVRLGEALVESASGFAPVFARN